MTEVKIFLRNRLLAEALARSLSDSKGISCRAGSQRDLASLENSSGKGEEQCVIILDCAEPATGRNGVLFQVKKKFPRCRPIMLCEDDSPEAVTALLNQGAWGVFNSDNGLPTLERAVLTVSGGEIWTCRKSSSHLIREFINGKAPKEDGDDKAGLSVRERQILALVGAGLKNRQIGEKLFISERTVKVHLNKVFKKIDVKDRLQAALYAIHNNITPSNTPLDR